MPMASVLPGRWDATITGLPLSVRRADRPCPGGDRGTPQGFPKALRAFARRHSISPATNSTTLTVFE